MIIYQSYSQNISKAKILKYFGMILLIKIWQIFRRKLFRIMVSKNLVLVLSPSLSLSGQEENTSYYPKSKNLSLVNIASIMNHENLQLSIKQKQ